jgi:pimeloyl-ACP methyl ester carboxylesterase
LEEVMTDWTDHDYVVSDGTRLHYAEMGEGTPVVLIHGAGGSAVGNWFANGIAPALAPTNRVIGIDMRGHGLSEAGPRSGMGSMAKDVIEFLDQQGIDKAHLGGYSMGGGVTLALLSSIPGRFLSAHFGGAGIPETSEWADKIPPDPTGGDPEAKAASAAYATAQKDRGAEVGNGAGAGPGAGAGAGAGGIRAAMANMTDEQRAEFAARRREQAESLDLTSVTFPVLAVNGEFDGWRAKTHRMWRELPNFTNVVLPGKGHLSAVMAGFIPQSYIDAMVTHITAANPVTAAAR